MKQRSLVYGLALPSALALALSACSTAHVALMPGEEMNRVVARDIERDGAEKAAIESANKYCTGKGKEAVFVSERQEYKGEMDEATRELLRKGSQAAILIGSVGMAPHEAHSPGALLGSAGTVGSVMTSGRDYEAVQEFKCR